MTLAEFDALAAVLKRGKIDLDDGNLELRKRIARRHGRPDVAREARDQQAKRAARTGDTNRLYATRVAKFERAWNAARRNEAKRTEVLEEAIAFGEQIAREQWKITLAARQRAQLYVMCLNWLGILEPRLAQRHLDTICDSISAVACRERTVDEELLREVEAGIRNNAHPFAASARKSIGQVRPV
jgi:hypothetical protein